MLKVVDKTVRADKLMLGDVLDTGESVSGVEQSLGVIEVTLEHGDRRVTLLPDDLKDIKRVEEVSEAKISAKKTNPGVAARKESEWAIKKYKMAHNNGWKDAHVAGRAAFVREFTTRGEDFKEWAVKNKVPTNITQAKISFWKRMF